MRCNAQSAREYTLTCPLALHPRFKPFLPAKYDFTYTLPLRHIPALRSILPLGPRGTGTLELEPFIPQRAVECQGLVDGMREHRWMGYEGWDGLAEFAGQEREEEHRELAPGVDLAKLGVS